MLFKKIKKIFQNLFKFLAQKIFKMIYGEIYINNSSTIENLKIHDIKNKNIITFFSNNYKVYQINFIYKH